ncbi:MAG: hypothetical protein WDN75_00130 [Bacteroidota bacterium]
MSDDRCKENGSLLLLFDRALNRIEETQAKIIDTDSFRDRLANTSVSFFGDGAAKCRDTITHINAVFLENIFPLASGMGTLAFEKFKNAQFEDLALFEPHT